MRFLTAGESHGPGIVALVEGMPAGVPIDTRLVDADLHRRQLGYGRGGRQRIEHDVARFTGGVRQGRTTGGPVAMLIENRDFANWERVMSASSVAEPPDAVTGLRPGHADLAGSLKYGYNDVRDSIERSSARETAARVAGGAIAKALLRLVGIAVNSETKVIGAVEAVPTFDDERVEASDVRCADPDASARMIAEIQKAKQEGDTLGGIVAVRATGLFAGLGSFSEWDRRLDGRIAQALCSIQAAKGVQFGDAFAASRERGSQVHDPIVVRQDDSFGRTRNRAGGLEGGVTNGEDIRVEVAFKPISTLMHPLPSVDLKTGESAPGHIERSDTCVIPAAGVVCEAMLAFILADALCEKFGTDSADDLVAATMRYRKRLKPLDKR